MEIEKKGQDIRGSVHEISYGDDNFLIFEIKQGYSRGGDSHFSDTIIFLIKGHVECKFIRENKEYIKKIIQGDQIRIFSKEPHILTALLDSILIEIILGKKGIIYYKPYRDIIKKQLQ